jgi:4-hydroxybenzoate polyprenyltransferase
MESGTTLTGGTLVETAGQGNRVALRDRLRLLRFQSWARFLVLPLAGLDLGDPLPSLGLALARGLVIAFCVLGFGYLANALGDRAMDRDPAKNPLVGGLRDETWARRVLALLLLGAVVTSLFGPASARLATLICLSSGWAYSLGPRLKGLPVVGTLMNVLNFAPLMYVAVGAEMPARLEWLVPAFAALLVQNQLLHEAADAPEDRAGRLRTTFLWAGPRVAALLAGLSGVVLLVVAVRVLLHGGWPLALAALALPFVLAFPALLWWRGDSPSHMARVRVAQRWCAAACGALLLLAGL